MIPKIVHYCWFGDTPMDARLGSYVNTWKALLPDYKFMLWNEDNIDFEEAIRDFKELIQDETLAVSMESKENSGEVYSLNGIDVQFDIEKVSK